MIKACLLIIGVVFSSLLIYSCASIGLSENKSPIVENTATIVSTWTPRPYPTRKPSRTPYPPPTRRATITPFPSSTPFGKIKFPSFNSSSSSSSSNNNNAAPATNCSIYNYAKTQYRNNVSFYKALYQPSINMYKAWIDEAVMDRDARRVLEYQRLLGDEMNALSGYLNAEKKQFNAAVPKECR